MLGVHCNRLPVFDGFFWTRWTSHRWWIPLLAISIYIPMVWLLPGVMKNREKMKLQKAAMRANEPRTRLRTILGCGVDGN